MWLIYSIPFLVYAMARESGWSFAASLVAYAVFLVLYFAGYWFSGRTTILIVAAMNVIGFLFSQTNPGAPSFFIFASALTGAALPRRRAFLTFFVQVIATCAYGLFFDLPLWFYIPAIVMAALIGGLTMAHRERNLSNASLQMAQEEVARLAKVAERERIARDLHDLLGHTLSVIVLKAELSRRLLPSDATLALKEIEDVERIARDGLTQVRSAITGYRASSLAAEIESVRKTLGTAGISAEVDIQSVSLAPAQETALSLALREATTNVIRHSQAQKCRIRFYAQGGAALLEVEDDGRGADQPFGNGLTGMRERLAALGGALARENLVDGRSGTRLLASLPLGHSA